MANAVNSLSSIPSVGVRYPREKLTATLIKLCEMLDQKAEGVDAPYKWRFPRVEGVARIEPVALWVFGSWARGATECNDLDLILEIAGDTSPLSTRDVRRAFFGAPRYVSLYTGTPLKNSSGVEAPEAKLIWKKGMDWRAAIDEVQIDPSAGRFQRSYDALPFKLERLACAVDCAEELIAEKEQGILDWTFVDLADLPDLSVDTEEEMNDWCRRHDLGKKTSGLIPYLFRFLEMRGQLDDHTLRSWGKTQFYCGGMNIHLGMPPVEASKLALKKFDTLVVMPHLKKGDRNGVWVITRGENHPVMNKAREREVFAAAFNGHISYVFDLDSESYFAEVYSTLDGAKRLCDELNKDFGPDEENPGEEVPVGVSGRELLSLLAYVDAIVFDGDEIDLRGYSFDISELLDRLPLKAA